MLKSKVPSHLKDLINDFNTSDVQYFIENIEWFNNLSWKGKLHYKNVSKFYIFYSGTKYEDGMIAGNSQIPTIIFAQPIDSDEKIVLFDERIHGYNAILIEEKKFDNPEFNLYIDNEGEKVFEVFIWTNSSIDFEDEFELTENNEIATIYNQPKSISFLQQNAYDYIGILIKNKHNVDTRILDMELV